jgi:hypothetical protein
MTTTNEATFPTFSLRDPKATHTGQIHYVYFQIRGDRAVIVTDDCVWHHTRFLGVEQARAEWQRYARLGFVRWDYADAAKIVEMKVREFEG